MMKRTTAPDASAMKTTTMTMTTTASPASPAAAAPKTTATRRARNSAAMPRPVRARAAASAAAAARQRAARPAAAAAAANAQPAAVNPRIAWAGGNNHTATARSSAAQDHGLTLHETLYADSRGAVHYRGAEDPRGDRRAVLGALRSMELEEAAFASSEHGSAGSAGPAGGRVVKASGGGRRAPWEGAGHAARQRLEPRKFLRGAKAVKHTHMVDQPARRGGAKA